MSLLAVEALSVRYGETQALAPVSLVLPQGGRMAVIGQSGSGKSTLAMAIANLLPPGAQRLGRVDWPGLGRGARPGADIGLVFQDASGSLDPLMRVGAQVREVVETHTDLRHGAAQARVLALLAQVELPDPAGAAAAWPHQLSGGQRQRVALACALAADPAILIADEMTSALDTLVQARIVAMLDRLVRARGMALMFVTHDIALAAGLADTVLVLDAGREAERFGPGRGLDTARHPATLALLAAHLDLSSPPLIGPIP